MSQNDCVIANGTGAVVLADMNSAIKALASCQSGAVQPVTRYAGMFWLDTSIAPNGYLRQRNKANTAWVDVIGIPTKATAAQAAAGNDTTVFLTPAMLKEQQGANFNYARNRIVNPAMQISQENGSNVVTNGQYAADQWGAYITNGAATMQRVKIGNQYRLRASVTTAYTPVASEYFAFMQRIEGLRLADFRFGTATAKKVILRFGWKGPAGTWGGTLRGTVASRTYAFSFVITAAQANTDQTITIEVPGDIAGTWAYTNGINIELWMCMALGPNYMQAAGSWIAGALLGPTGMTNGLAATTNVFELFDVGLYPDLTGSGQPPQWKLPDETQELLACQRYYVMEYTIWCGNPTGAGIWYGITTLPVDMRIATPTMTQETNSGATASFPATSTYLFLPPRALRVMRAATVGGTAQYFHEMTNVSARM
jgi:hypothetical protein